MLGERPMTPGSNPTTGTWSHARSAPARSRRSRWRIATNASATGKCNEEIYQVSFYGEAVILFHVTIPGPIRGAGKNHVGITRTGRRYPLKGFAGWREVASLHVLAVRRLLPLLTFPIRVPVRGTMHYWPADRRKRDVPAIEDALWNLMEHCGIVEDDYLIRDAHFFTHMDTDQPPGITLTLEAL